VISPIYGAFGTHNSLAGLQGGSVGQYYHLDLATYTAIQNGTLSVKQVTRAQMIAERDGDGYTVGFYLITNALAVTVGPSTTYSPIRVFADSPTTFLDAYNTVDELYGVYGLDNGVSGVDTWFVYDEEITLASADIDARVLASAIVVGQRYRITDGGAGGNKVLIVYGNSSTTITGLAENITDQTRGTYVLSTRAYTVTGGGGGTWGSITGTLSSQTDLQSALNAKQNALGFTPENVANKTDVMSGNTTSSIKFLSAKGAYDWVTSFLSTWINGLTAKTTPVDADAVAISDSGASGVSKKVTLANLKAYIVGAGSAVAAYTRVVTTSSSPVITRANLNTTTSAGVIVITGTNANPVNISTGASWQDGDFLRLKNTSASASISITGKTMDGSGPSTLPPRASVDLVFDTTLDTFSIL